MAAAALYKGYTAKKAAYAEADQLERQAGLEMVTSEHAADEERRQGRYIRSRALAASGASGGNADDPTVVNILGDIKAESEYRSLTQLFNGQERSLSLKEAATAKRREGRAAMVSGILEAGSTVAGGYGSAFGGAAKTATPSMFERYGGTMMDTPYIPTSSLVA